MRIHTVKEGDTIFKIARAYATPPAKIIENNALNAPDRLYPGQKLIILTPTRSYTARGGDTLDSIAARFDTDKRTLLMNNPELRGRERIYPGQIIAVRYDTKPYGNAAVNGYYSRGGSRDRLSQFMPYLTYLTLSASRWDCSGLKMIFDAKSAIEEARLNKTVPILRVYTEMCSKELLSNAEKLCEALILAAKRAGYGGILLAAYRASEEADAFLELFDMLKAGLHKEGLLIQAELDGNRDIAELSTLSRLADASIFNYEKGKERELPSFKCGEERVLKAYADTCDKRKTLVDLSVFAYLNGEAIEFSELDGLLRRRGIEPEYSEESKFCEFTMNKYKGDKHEEILVRYPAPENTKAKLELIGELGYMGVSFDIERAPLYSLMSFNSLFRAEKAIDGGCGICRCED